MKSSEPMASFDLLSGVALFSSLSEETLRALAAHTSLRFLPAGSVLMHEGQPGEALYALVSGRLRVSARQPDSTVAVVGEVAPGEVVGEMALLGDQPHSATVEAVRDSYVLEIARADFEKLSGTEPGVALAVARLTVARLGRSIHHRAGAGRVRSVALVPAVAGHSLEDFAARLVSAFRPDRSVGIVTSTAAVADLGEESLSAPAGSSLDLALTEWLNRREAAHDLVLYVDDHDSDSWTKRSYRQADRVLVIGRAGKTAMWNSGGIPDVTVRTDLVIVHPPGARMASGTSTLLTGHHYSAHHHVRDASPDDFARLARSLSGRSIGLVLSGGGARGLAHIGVMRALEEAGVPIDNLGGASFGALMAAVRARGDDSSGVAAAMEEFLISRGSPLDLTAPAAALTGGRKVVTMLRDGFGDLQIEDLWHRFFCVSSNLTRGTVHVHSTGPVRSAVRASISIPGLFPPVNLGNGEVLVDGAVINNLPVDVMRPFNGAGPILAVNLRGELPFRSQDLPHHGVLSGWRVFARRINPFASTLELPGLIDVLLRTTEMGSVLSSKTMEQQADVVFHPPVHDVDLLDFGAHDRLIQAGYQHAVEVLEEGGLEVLEG